MGRGLDEVKEVGIFPIREEDIEEIARKEHNEWLELMVISGFHPPSHCTQYGRGCHKCNPDVLPFDGLPEEARKRQLDRILNLGQALEDIGHALTPASPFGNPEANF